MGGFVVWWMKRDLRVADNAAFDAALNYAHAHGCALMALWITEPEEFEAAEYHPRRQRFVFESLLELESSLQPSNVDIFIAEGHATEVFNLLVTRGLLAVFSHEETGVLWTYERDKRLTSFSRSQGLLWHEFPTNGVVRGLRDRGLWQSEFRRRMSADLVPRREQLVLHPLSVQPTAVESASAPLRLIPWHQRAQSLLEQAAKKAPRHQQRGGESVAHGLLQRFLAPDIHSKYVRHLSRPHEAQYFSSRLSPYLAFGCISSRQILATVRALPSESFDFRSLSAFQSRLAWRCHFMQKLESFPDMELYEQNKALAGLRPVMSVDEAERWREGQTGFPLVDACLRSVHQNGFLNFRMRAMLMSFATHLMWRDWHLPAWDLARAFLDFEPGIHFAQVQMQAAVTGNNQIRIYNPLKQSEENDSECRFIKRWVPELKDVQPEKIHACEDLPHAYSKPIVEFRAAMSYARENLFAKFREPDVRAEARIIQDKLGSRGGPLSWRGRQSVRREKSLPREQTSKRSKRASLAPSAHPTLFDESDE